MRARRVLELTRSVLSNPTTVFGVVLIVGMLAMALFAPLIAPPNTPDPYQMPRDWSNLNVPPGSPGHILGTTDTGG
ncbi:MAG: D,D-dipeptide ABC transporter permease, partial [Acidimicrobiia bacterium]